MKVWTSYFGQMRKISTMDCVPVAVCLYPPKWYDGAVCDKLAPTHEMMMGMRKEETRDFFAIKYEEEILGRLKREEILEELQRISDGKDVVLVCYEKPTDFCHRKLIGKWIGASELQFGS